MAKVDSRLETGSIRIAITLHFRHQVYLWTKDEGLSGRGSLAAVIELQTGARQHDCCVANLLHACEHKNKQLYLRNYKAAEKITRTVSISKVASYAQPQSLKFAESVEPD